MKSHPTSYLKFIRIVHLGIVLSALPSSASADVARFRDGLNDYIETRDMYLAEANPNASLFTEDRVRIQSVPGATEQGLLKFDFVFGPGPNQIPVNAIINYALLDVLFRDGTTGTISLHTLLRGFSEGDTWNSLTNGISLDDVEASSVPDASITNFGFGYQEFDVTERLRQTQQTGTTGWVFVSDSTDEASFASDDSVNFPRPELLVDYTIVPVPEPSTALFGASLIVFATLQRQRKQPNKPTASVPGPTGP